MNIQYDIYFNPVCPVITEEQGVFSGIICAIVWERSG